MLVEGSRLHCRHNLPTAANLSSIVVLKLSQSSSSGSNSGAGSVWPPSTSSDGSEREWWQITDILNTVFQGSNLLLFPLLVSSCCLLPVDVSFLLSLSSSPWTIHLCFYSTNGNQTCSSRLPTAASLSAVSSPRHRYFSPLSGDPAVSHRGRRWCWISGQEKYPNRASSTTIWPEKKTPEPLTSTF